MSCPTPKPSSKSPCGKKHKPIASGSAAATSTGESNSVVLATGQFNFALPVISAAALGAGSWEFALEYLANNGVADFAGVGWSHSQGYQLILLAGGDIALITPENTVEMFITNGAGQWLSGYNNTQATLVEINAGTTNDTFILTSDAGVVTEFFGFYTGIATPGRMKSTTDRFGSGQTLVWATVAGVLQLASVTDSYGRTVNYSYYGSTGNYLLSQITDFMGRQVNFQYDAAGHLIAIVLPNINNAAAGNTFPGGTAYVFEYDVNNTDPNRQNDLIKIWYPNETLPYLSNRSVDTASVYANATPRYTITYGQSAGPAIEYGAVLTETVGDPAGGVGGSYSFSYSNTGLPSNLIDPSDPIVSQTTMTDRNGNISIYNFNYNGMVVMKQVQTNRNKSSLETGPYTTWTQYNNQNQKLLEVMPAGDSVACVYDSGMIDFGAGPQLYPPRQGLLLSETHYPGNTIGVPSRPGSNGQTQLTTSYFYEPLFNELCAQINEKGNPVATSGGANVYFAPQNGGTVPTDADRSRYATITTFDYQKNQTSTITGSGFLQSLLGLTPGQIQSLLNYANSQMIAGGLPNGFQTNLGDINGDGTGDGTGGAGPQESTAAPMLANPVQTANPAAYQLVPNPSYPGSGDPWLWQTQNRLELFTYNLRGQMTTLTNAEGNITVYVRYPENNPDGDYDYYDPNLSSNQYGRVKQIVTDADPTTVMTLVGSEGDMVAFSGNIIPRTNTPGIYQTLTTTHQGATGCTSCNYDPLGNILTTVDARGNLTSYDRTEMGEAYRVTVPAPYGYMVETQYDANRNVNRVDTQDMIVLYTSTDPSDPGYAQFTPSGSGSTANVPLTAGPGGTVRSGWFTNLYTYDLLDNKIEDDIDATGSSPASLITTYAYDANENLITVTKPNGNTVEQDYDERNLLIVTRVGYDATTGVAGAVSALAYDANGNLIDAIGPVERGTANNSLSITIADAFGSGSSLTHTGDWQMANTCDGFNRVVSITDVVGGVVNNTYDPTGANIERQVLGTAGGAVPIDRTGSANVPLTDEITRYDEADRAYEIQRAVFLNTGISGGAPTNNLPSGRSATHGGGGLAANSTTNSNTGVATLTSGQQSYVLARNVYDRLGRLTGRAEDNGAVSTTAFDGADRAIQTTDVLGNIINYTFDGNSNVTGTTRVELFSSSVASESFASLMLYDVMNRLVVRADQGADGTISSNLSNTSTLFTLSGYNSRGLRTNVIDPKQNTTIGVYDGAGRELQLQQNLRTGGVGTNPVTSTITTQFGYDGNSNRIRLVDSNSGTTVWTYDTLDRATSETFQDGSKRQFVYDYANDVITYTDENGSVFNNVWDPMGRKASTSITPASGIGGTTAQSFQYNGLGQMTFSADTVGSNSAEVTVAFDSIQRSVEEGQSYGGNTRYATNTYFLSLPAVQFTFPNARQINSYFDQLYRRVQVVGDVEGSEIAAWQFFGPNRVALFTLTGNGLVCSYMNDAQTRSAIQAGQTTPGWGNITTDQLGYDGAARLIGKRFFSGSNVVVGYTAAYDKSSDKLFDRPLQIEERSSLYDSYDSTNRLLDYQRGVLASGGGSVTTPITLPNTDASRSYNLDALGNWSSSVYTPEGAGSSITDQRNHNKLNEITIRTLTGQSSVTFEYDGTSGASNGNLTYDGTLVYQYDALNRLITVSTYRSGTASPDWGGVGSGTVGSEVIAGGGTTGTVEVVLASYVYDATNRRIRKTVTNGGLAGDIPNGTTDSCWFGWQTIEERNPFGGSGSTDTPMKQYVWGTYVDECVQINLLVTAGSQSLPTGYYYPLQDTLYRTVALTNSSGAIVEAYDNDAYGNTLIFTAADSSGNWWSDSAVQSAYGANDVIYCGYRYDAETANYYVRNRYYSPTLGRWLTRDPIGYQGGINLYAYVASSPVGNVDAEGTSLWTGLGNLLSEIGNLVQSALAIYKREISELKTRQALNSLPPYLRTYHACKLKLPPLHHHYGGPTFKKLTGGFGEGNGNISGSVNFPIGGTPFGIGLSGSAGLSGTGPAITPNKGMFTLTGRW